MPHVYPETNSLGEPLLRLLRDLAGNIVGAEYRVTRDDRPCACGCGEAFAPTSERSVIAVGYEWRWVLKGHGTMARSKRLGRATVPLMATGEAAGEWKEIERAAREAHGLYAAEHIGSVGQPAPANSDTSEAT